MKKIKITEVLIMSLKKKIAGVLLATMCTAFFAGAAAITNLPTAPAAKKYKLNIGM